MIPEYPDESFSLRFTGAPPHVRVHPTDWHADFLITDDGDRALVYFKDGHRLSVKENVGVHNVTIARTTGYLYGTVRVYLSTNTSLNYGNLSATSGIDYTPLNRTLVVFPPGVSEVNVTLTILDDNEFEDTEMLDLYLTFVGEEVVEAGLLPGGDRQRLAIVDDGDNTFALEQATYSNSENVAYAGISVRRYGSTAHQATIRYSTRSSLIPLNIRATPGTDYQDYVESPSTGSLVFAPQEVVKNFFISVINDGLYEAPDEQVGIELVRAECTKCSITGPYGRSTATLTLLDDKDAGVIDFASSHFTVCFLDEPCETPCLTAALTSLSPTHSNTTQTLSDENKIGTRRCNLSHSHSNPY